MAERSDPKPGMADPKSRGEAGRGGRDHEVSEEAGAEKIPGQADSAPHGYSLARAALRATIVSAIAFALFYTNYLYGWVTIRMLEWATPPG